MPSPSPSGTPLPLARGAHGRAAVERLFPAARSALARRGWLAPCVFGLRAGARALAMCHSHAQPVAREHPADTCGMVRWARGMAVMAGPDTACRALGPWLRVGCVRWCVLTLWGLADGDDMLASASGDQTIRVWDMQPERPEVTATLRGHKGSVKSVQFRPQSRFELVSGARGGDIILWDTRVGQGAVTTLSVQVWRTFFPPIYRALPAASRPKKDTRACSARNAVLWRGRLPGA